MSKLKQTNTIFTISKELQIKLLTWHNETSHESIVVKVKLANSYGISKTNLNYAWINTQNSLDYPSDTITKVYLFHIYIFLCLAPLSFLIDPCIKH